ncbi:MAG TPA: non-homologous end-joining DNA ligase [Thermoleophilaceae bacterium]|nr:non-homologous end-joining DNA ligase [Thermoleophilaceae bacterium]
MSDPAPTKAQAMKAVLTDERFSDPDWIYERKLDGVRCVAIRDGDRVRLLSRNDLSMNDRYPEVVEVLEAQECRRFAIDGEVVAFDHGQTSFARLARRGRERVAVFLYAFDITWLDGEDLRDRPLTERKRRLRDALDFGGPLRLSAHRRENGEEYFAEACRKGWEGLIAKRADSRYTAARSKDWLKFKCERGQELVIGGYTPPQGSRQVLGALLMGYFADGELRYAGKVGTGFDQATLAELGERLAPLRRDGSPFAERITGVAGATWAEPELVAEIGFTEWTRHGRLRHPRFLGLRFDKPASAVVREA